MKISRRQFIAGAGAAAGVAAVGGGAAVALSSSPSSSPSPGRPGTLVLVALYGGNDGLNTVIPYQDPAYLSGRSTIGFQPHEVIPLDNELALNPALTGLKSLWDAKKLAIVRGVGYPDPNYSHFRSMDIWQSAAPATDEVTGWLGRWLDGLGDKDPLAAMSIGPTLPKALQGNNTAGASIPAGAITLPNATSVSAPFSALNAVSGASLAARVAQSGTDLLTVLHAVQGVLATSPAVTAPASALGAQLGLVARLIKGGLSTRVYMVSLGGFDTHSDEKTTQQRLLAEVDAAISSFVTTMEGTKTVLMTFSEFGRRVGQNASGGTDHGSASPLFVAGPTVKGGYYGDEPSLTDLDDGNLKFTTDFRSVYATVMANVVGVDPKSVLLGQSFPTLGFV